MIKEFNANKARLRRHRRLRNRLTGTPARPRLSVFRSGKHMYAQIVDDSIGRTIVAASSLDPALRAKGAPPLPAKEKKESDEAAMVHTGIAGIEQNHKVALARAVGQILAERAKAAGITQVVFDRGGYPYHGRIAALAAGAREGGLDF